MKHLYKVICSVCSAEYEVEKHRLLRTKCCSRQCAQRYAASFAGERNIAVLRGTGTKHPYVKEKGRHQHRVVAERKLGRPLESGEIVHHIDGNGKNNHPDNLIIMTQSDHIKLHRSEMVSARILRRGY